MPLKSKATVVSNYRSRSQLLTMNSGTSAYKKVESRFKSRKPSEASPLDMVKKRRKNQTALGLEEGALKLEIATIQKREPTKLPVITSPNNAAAVSPKSLKSIAATQINANPLKLMETTNYSKISNRDMTTELKTLTPVATAQEQIAI